MSVRIWFFATLGLLLLWQLGLAVTGPFFWRPPKSVGDGPDYECIAYSLSTGRGFGFVWDDGNWKSLYEDDIDHEMYVHLDRDSQSGLTTVRPPLLPFVIATVYSILPRGPFAMAAVRVVLVMCLAISGALAVSVAFKVASRIWSNSILANMAAGITLLLAVLDKTIRTYTEDFLTEPFALLWTTLFLSIAITIPSHSKTRGRLFAMALLWALLVLTRSLYVLWLPTIIALLLFAGLGRRHVIWFVGVTTLCLLPWFTRNCVLLGTFMPLGSQGVPSMLGGYNDAALNDGGNWQPEPQLAIQEFVESQSDSKKFNSLQKEVLVSRLASEQLRDWVWNNLTSLPALAFAKLKTHWGPYWGTSLLWRLAIVLGVIGLIHFKRREGLWFIGLPLISSITVMILYETGGRFLVPLYGLLYALAGLGVAYCFSFITLKKVVVDPLLDDSRSAFSEV